MVSFWPFKGRDDSATFEKTLSTLSTKITQTTTRLDTQRQHSRRFKALWTLYTTFAYLLYSIVLVLVLGWRDWGMKEYDVIVGGPALIYVVRAAGSRFFEYRISKTSRYLDSLYKQRDETIEKLKVATKYNSTQQLLEKYGGDSPSSGKSRAKNERKDSSVTAKSRGAKGSQKQAPVPRTGLPPPPTANIRRPMPIPPQEVPQGLNPGYSPSSTFPSPPPPPPYPPQSRPIEDAPGFAPNAFPPPSSQYAENASHWYDRLFDVLLGEDETQPRNRLVLLCTNCRLVNGQAPPGVKTAEELGRWRCFSCGAWNGEESETKKVLADIKSQSRARESQTHTRPQAGDAAWEPVSVENVSSGEEATDEAGVIVATSEDDREGQTEMRDEDEHVQGDTESASELQSEPELETEPEPEPEPEPVRKPKRGRPKGSKNRKG